MFKKLLSGIMAVAVCVVGLSGCGESPPEETTSETTTEVTTAKTTTAETTTQTTTKTATEATTTTEYELTDEDLELLNSMPEIVFVMSHHYDGSNIRGLFVTNTGEIKIYDFGQTAPDETYEIPDVYDKLEEAVCSEIVVEIYSKNVLTTDDLFIYSKSNLVECYKLLLQASGNIYKNEHGITTGLDEGHFRYYGIRNNKFNEHDFILLSGLGDIYRYYTDEDCYIELNKKVISDMAQLFFKSAWSE